MKKLKFLVPILMLTLSSYSQEVTISTLVNDKANVEIDGSLKISEKIYLENPGQVTGLNEGKLLIQATNNEILSYDIEMSKYGPMNYTQYAFNNVSSVGLQSYDTKIPVSKYLLTVQGFYFTKSDDDVNIVLLSSNGADRIEGYTVRGYAATAIGATEPTWHLQAFGTDSNFRNVGSPTNTNVNIYLNVFTFRRGFVTRDQGSVTVDMNNQTTNNNAALPGSFVIFN